MFRKLLKRKKWLLLLLAAGMAAALFGACAPVEEEEKMTIKLANTEYDTVWLMNAVAEIILEDGYGYTVEDLSLSVPVSQVSLASGDIHVWLDTWWWYCLPWWEPAIENGEIEELGVSMEPDPSFWTIPAAVSEEYNIKTVFDMKEPLGAL